MSVQIEQLIYYVKELCNTDIIEMTEKGFRYQFNINAVPMDCFIEVEQDSFVVKANDKSMKIYFLSEDLKGRFKQLTDYIIVLKEFISNTKKYDKKKLRE